jgi:hypothetical protein
MEYVNKNANRRTSAAKMGKERRVARSNDRFLNMDQYILNITPI